MLLQLTQAFQWILSTSLMAAVLVVFILAAKLLLGERLKPRWSYLLWMLLALRLLLPWTPESSFSIFNVVTLDMRMETNEAGPAELPSVQAIREPAETEAVGQQPIAASGSVQQSPAKGQKDSAQELQVPAHRQQSAAELGSATDAPMPLSPIASDTAEQSAISFWQVLSVIWLVGGLAAAGMLIRVNVRFFMKIKREARIAGPDNLAVFEQCKRELGIRRSVALMESKHIGSPTLTGVFRPRLLMPTGFSELLSERELRHIYWHELCHLKRNDLPVNAVMNALLILHWFNPLLWFAYNKLREDQELACDSMALARMGTHESKDYARTIIKLLELFSAPARRLASTVAISGSKKELERRITMILTRKPNAYRWSLLGISLMLLLSGCMLTNASEGSSGEMREFAGLETPALPQTAADPGELLAENDGIALYGTRTQDDMIEGITVRTSEGSKTFDWKHKIKFTGDDLHPYVNVGDVDADGRDEIVIFLIASDAMERPDYIYKQEIHVLNMEDFSELPVEDPMKAIQERVKSSITENEDTVTVAVDTGDERREENYAKILNSAWDTEVNFHKEFYYIFTEEGIKTVVTGSYAAPETGVTNRLMHLLVEYDSSLKVKKIKIPHMA